MCQRGPQDIVIELSSTLIWQLLALWTCNFQDRSDNPLSLSETALTETFPNTPSGIWWNMVALHQLYMCILLVEQNLHRLRITIDTRENREALGCDSLKVHIADQKYGITGTYLAWDSNASSHGSRRGGRGSAQWALRTVRPEGRQGWEGTWFLHAERLTLLWAYQMLQP